SGPASRGCSLDWKMSTQTISPRRRSARTRSPNIARCCLPGRRRASSRLRATSWASLRIPPDRISRDIPIIQRELPLDIIEFFCLTPLPGSEDHQILWRKGVPMEPELNAYDVEHVCTAHANMTKAEWEAIYREAWSLYYTPEHTKTLMRRA